MSEELEVKTEAAAAEPSVEDVAKSKGWVPPEEAVKRGLDPKDAVDAKTYLDREPFIKQIKLLNQRNKTMAQKVDELLQKFNAADKRTLEKSMEDLESQKIYAYQSQDYSKAKAIEAELEKHKAEVRQLEAKQVQEAPAEAIEFAERNKSWFQTDTAATSYAILKEQEYRLRYPGMELNEIFDLVQKDVDEFRGVSAEAKRPAPVASPKRSSAPAAKSDSGYSLHDLKPEAKDVYMSMKTYYRDEFKKDYTVDEFVKNQLKANYVNREDLLDE
jgi:hypothetical protein